MAEYLKVMTQFLPKNSSASPAQYETAIKGYMTKLEKIPAEALVHQGDTESFLKALDPSRNSLAYLRILHDNMIRPGTSKEQAQHLIDHSLIFFATFDPVQVRYGGEMWRKVWERTLDHLGFLGELDVTPLSTALLRLCPSSGTLTSMHLRLLRSCLGRGTPSQTLPILDQNIYAFPQVASKGVEKELACEEHDQSNAYVTADSGFSDKLKPEFVMEYFLLGAHVYIGVRNYDRARLFLEMVMLHPTSHHATSALQVEAHKKWTLVGLVAEGKPFPFPRTIEQAVWKNLKTMSKHYDALAESFVVRDWRKYRAEVHTAGQLWSDDGNLGLVNEAGRALVRYRVADLQKTYAALPVGRVSEHLNLSSDETLNMLGQMIQQGKLNANLSPGSSSADTILRFQFSQPTGSSSQDDDMEAQTKRIESLIAAVRDADRRLQLTKDYIEVQKRNKRTGPETDPADQMDLSWDVPAGPTDRMLGDEGEEDIMA